MQDERPRHHEFPKTKSPKWKRMLEEYVYSVEGINHNQGTESADRLLSEKPYKDDTGCNGRNNWRTCILWRWRSTGTICFSNAASRCGSACFSSASVTNWWCFVSSFSWSRHRSTLSLLAPFRREKLAVISAYFALMTSLYLARVMFTDAKERRFFRYFGIEAYSLSLEKKKQKTYDKKQLLARK